ncbi:hypothetical protein BDZ89DRAFT_1152588 [Hymenopellis radicata]|nr:hypothetical protein BDZ89DRAFT_1152588 [Hymenopellis radicata]
MAPVLLELPPPLVDDAPDVEVGVMVDDTSKTEVTCWPLDVTMTVVATTVVTGCCEVVWVDKPPDDWPAPLVVPLVLWVVVDDDCWVVVVDVGCVVVDVGWVVVLGIVTDVSDGGTEVGVSTVVASDVVGESVDDVTEWKTRTVT